MTDAGVVAIARIPLARSTRRLLIVPILLLALAAGAVAGGLLLLPSAAGWALAATAAVPVLAALYLLAVLFTVRLDVEVSTLRLRWIRTDRRYALARGAVTRVPLTGERRAKLRPRFGAFGWGLGAARLRGEEQIQLVRLARSTAVIVVPTESGRIAVAPRSEEQFLEALAAAARVQQRLDQVAARARAIPVARLSEEIHEAPVLEPEQPPRPLTGIERTLLEERLAAERAAALAAAEQERIAAEREAALAAVAASTGGEVVAEPEVEARRRLPRPSRPKLTLPRPRIGALALPGGRLASIALAALPLVAAGAIWGAGQVVDAFPISEARAEQLSVGLTLAGPAASLAAVAARAWFPRLTGLVIVTAACALILVGRSLFS